MCNADTGNWFGDCMSCKPGFFRAFNAASCLDHCPTGSIQLPLLNECSDPGVDGFISSVAFNKLGNVYKGLPFGLYNLVPGFDIGHLAPQSTLDRGLFFNGKSGHVKISGIILNSKFTVHFWAYFFEFAGDLLKVDAETPTTAGEDQEMTYTCG